MTLDSQKSAELQKLFKKMPQVLAVYFYGSRIKEYAKKTSDLDIAVIVDSSIGIDYGKLYSQVGKIINFFELDLRIVTLKDTPTYLFGVVSGRCIYKRSEDDRISFETRVIKNFYDGKYMRDIYYNYLKQNFGVN